MKSFRMIHSPTTQEDRLTTLPCYLFLVSCLTVLLTGCGEDRQELVPVAGQVLIDGKPLSLGSVKFVPEGARQSVGRLDENGRFVLTCYKRGDGAAIGTHRISILASESISDDVTRWHTPKKYADHKTSGVTKEITEPTGDLVIEISWDGGKPFDERS